MRTDIIWGRRRGRWHSLAKALRWKYAWGVFRSTVPTVGKGEFGRLRPEAGEGAGALGHEHTLSVWNTGLREA